jgi:hypothetical protein
MKRRLWIVITFVFTSLVFYFMSGQPKAIGIPITVTPFGCPALSTKIEGKTYLLGFDLGSKFSLSLSKSILDSMNEKGICGEAHWQDAKGNFYASPSYRIPSVKIGDLVLTDVVARQENDFYKFNTTLWDDGVKEQHHGSLGRPLLEKTNLLLDFQHSIMIASNDRQQLQKMGYNLKNMTRVPFQKGENGIIVIRSETDAGTLKLCLDTGSTITLIRASRLSDQKCTIEERGFSVCSTKRFLIGNKDFGAKNLFLYDLSPEFLEIDGVLGMDFLKNHIIYIDYKNEMIYL